MRNRVSVPIKAEISLFQIKETLFLGLVKGIYQMVIHKDYLLSVSDSSASSSPIVSVIIPTYNREQYLEKAVQSVLKQTFTNLECLIVDDGSTDNTRELSENLMSLDQRVRYLYKENGGVSSARNFGIEHARGEWIQLLDSDDWLHHEKISFQLDYMKNSDCDDVVLYCDHELVIEIFIEGEGQRKTFYEYDCSSKEEMIEHLLNYFCLHCNGLIFKKTIAKKVMFEPTLSFLEDCKFQLDILMQNISFIHTPMIGHYYRIHQSNTCTFGDIADWRPSSKDSYIKYYQIIQEQYKDLRQMCQERLIDFMKRTIKQKDTERFDKILSLLDIPIKLYGLKFTKKSQLKFWQMISLYVPIHSIYNLGRMFKKVLHKSRL